MACVWILGMVWPACAQQKVLPAVRPVLAQTAREAGLAASIQKIPVSTQAASFSAAQSARVLLDAKPYGAQLDASLVQNAFFNKKEGSLYRNLKKAVLDSWKKSKTLRRGNLSAFSISSLTQMPDELLTEPSSQMQRDVYKSYLDVIQFWKESFNATEEWPLFKAILMPTLSVTATSLKGNQLSLFFSRKVAEKAYWLRAFPEQGRKQLFSWQGEGEKPYLASRLAQEKLVFFGEMHHFEEIHDNLGELIVEIKKQNPNRRVVLFTEFIDLPLKDPGMRNTVDTYYRRIAEERVSPITMADGERVDYAPVLFWVLLKNNIEIYPLEDATQKKIFNREIGPEEELSVFTLTERNKVWARVMENKMAEIRQTDPDALFLVYAGMGHTSWLMPCALPKFFAPENPAVVEITSKVPSNVSLLYNVWGKEDEFFQPANKSRLYYWQGNDARLLGKQTGFDYAWVVAPL